MADAALSALFDGAQEKSDLRFCIDCDAPLFERKPKQKLCPVCSEGRARERNRVRANKGVVGSTKACDGCGVDIVMSGSRQKFCAPCADVVRLSIKREADRATRKNNGSIPLGASIVCAHCMSVFVKTATVQKYCSPECRLAAARKGMPIGTCRRCDAKYEQTARRQFYCPPCGEISAAEKARQYRETNKHNYDRSRKKYVERNKSEILSRAAEIKRDRRQSDPSFAIECRVSSSLNQALRRLKAGRRWESLVGYTLDDLMRHLERQFLPNMTWENRDEWHIDHIVPISSFVFADENDPNIRACWALTNLRPLWAVDNMSKNDKRLFLI